MKQYLPKQRSPFTRTVRNLAVVALASLAVSSANAQSPREPDIGSNISHPKRAEISDDSTLSSEERGRAVMNDYARCLVDRASPRIVAVIALRAGDDLPALKKLASDECLENGSMTFSAPLLRGALFGELYRRQQRGLKRVQERFPPAPLDWFSTLPSDAPAQRINFFMLGMTECVAKSHAQAVRSVVIARTASQQQTAAYAEIIPALGPCIPQGQKLAFSRATLEGAFGEYLYRSLVPAIMPAKAGPK